jgi:enhancer of polycomb-like protein
MQIAEKLKRMRRELEDGRQLIILTYEREMLKRELLGFDRAIFEQRQKLKEMKIRLGIKGDDEDLFNQKVCEPGLWQLSCALTILKPQKRKASEVPAIQRPPGGHLRLPIRPDGKSMDADLVLLSDKLAEKENELRIDIENKIYNHRKWNQNYVDLTRDPLSPVREQGMELRFRPAKTQYLMTPPASTSSESMDIDEEIPAPEAKRTVPIFHFAAGGAKEVQASRPPAYRRRIGRLNRLWIDRRGLATPPRAERSDTSDRWKYDSDDDDEPVVYQVNPFDTRALKFRATVPLPDAIYQRSRARAEALMQAHAHQAAVAATRPAVPQLPLQPQPAA